MNPWKDIRSSIHEPQPHEETWHVANDRVVLDPHDRSTSIALFENEGITIEDAERDGGIAHSMARAKLAAVAPEMARLLKALYMAHGDETEWLLNDKERAAVEDVLVRGGVFDGC